MTKADIVAQVADKTGMEKVNVLATVEAFMDAVRANMEGGKNIYLRGFGSFIIKRRAQKTARNISKNTSLIIPAHNIPAFRPAHSFAVKVKKKVKA